MRSRDEIYRLVDDLITKDEFEERIKVLREEFDDLFDEEILAMMVVDELGRNVGHVIPISELKPGMNCTVFGKVIKMLKINEFEKNGSKGRVANLRIMDNTGVCNLALWNGHADLVESITVGTTIKVINGYTKQGEGCIELNVGKWGKVEIEPNDAPTIKVNTITGELIRKEDTEVWLDNSGNAKFFKRIWLKVEKEMIPIVVWDEHVKVVQSIEEGERITIYRPVKRFSNNIYEIHVDGESSITKS
ncbi:MAG TPA: hypothetical protein ENG74_01225 [Thermoplasmatales archaeon]|nr:hypothetical protein [Thermoplasmatales archaeon]